MRAKGLVFAAGVIARCCVSRRVLLSLRAGGEQIGWGFQLQSPLFVTLLVYLLLAVGLNLSGVFEVGGGLAGVGDDLTQGDSYRASFFTGVLTTLVATPCTAPFMAPAVGAALTQSPLNALCIFAALGVGLSLPYRAAVVRALDAPRAAQAGRLDGHAEAGVCVPDLCHRRRGCCGCSRSRPRPSAWAPHWPAHPDRRWPPGPTRNPRPAAGGGRVTVLATAVVALLLALFLPLRFADVAAAARSAPAAAAPGRR